MTACSQSFYTRLERRNKGGDVTQRKLAVVPDGAKSKRAPRKPATLKAATARSERVLLEAMRSRLAAEIDGGVPAHALAPLMRQLRELDKEIRHMAAKSEGDEVGRAADTDDSGWRAEAL
jgi:hypothetical protein